MCLEERDSSNFEIQQTTAIVETTIAETTIIEVKLSEKTTALEEIELGLFFKFTRNYGALRAPPLLASAPRGHFRLGRPLKALRPLEGPGEARDHQGPPGINAVVILNRLSQKKISASAGL